MFINQDNLEESIYVFNDIDKSWLAGIEYVIHEYGNEEWFNAALHKVITDIYTKTKNEICTIPFTIIKKKT